MYNVDILIGICWTWKCNDGHKSSWHFFEQQLCYWYKREIKVPKFIYSYFAQTHLPSLTQMNQTTCLWNIMQRIQLNFQFFQFHGICLSPRALALQMELSLGRRHAKFNWWIVRKIIDALCWLWELVAILQHLLNKLSWTILIQQWDYTAANYYIETHKHRMPVFTFHIKSFLPISYVWRRLACFPMSNIYEPYNLVITSGTAYMVAAFSALWKQWAIKCDISFDSGHLLSNFAPSSWAQTINVSYE